MFGGGFMFYLSSASSYHNKYGIVDTRDGIVEYITKQDLLKYRQQGINIVTQGYETSTEFRNLDDRMIRTFYRESIRGNVNDFLSNHALPSYDFSLISKNCVRKGILKLYDYKDTKGFYIVVFKLQSLSVAGDFFNIAILRENSLFAWDVVSSCETLKFGEYPCGSGFLHQNVDKRDYGLNNDDLYLRLYLSDRNEIVFIRIPDFKTTVLIQ